jgi:hypothetical protein
MKILAVCSSLDLRYPFSCTPSWWQMFKGLYEIGVEVVAIPYQSHGIESLWWKAYDNPAQLEGAGFATVRRFMRRFRKPGKGEANPKHSSRESLADKLTRTLANALVRPKWQRCLSSILEQEKDVDAIIIFTVPLNHLRGLPSYLKTRYSIPVLYYDGDVPASLPAFEGFASGFRIYQGADLTEYDAFISNSKGGAAELKRMGARQVHVLYYGADPAVFSPVDVDQDIDVFFYGHGYEYRRQWIEAMIVEPSRKLPQYRFALRGTAFDIELGRTERLPYASFSKLREYACRSRINLNITRQAHASVYASSSARLFELAAMGCCIVSNPVEGLGEWFEPGREIFAVHSAEEALATYRQLLTDEEERREVGRRARERVLREHTYQKRARELVRIVQGR